MQASHLWRDVCFFECVAAIVCMLLCQNLIPGDPPATVFLKHVFDVVEAQPV